MLGTGTITATRRGFTLVELMVTIGVLGLLMGLITLRLDSLVPAMRLKSSARELASRLEQAYNHSVVSGYEVRFEYDLDAGAYRFYYPFEMDEDEGIIVGEGETVLVDWEPLPGAIWIQDVLIGDSDPIVSGQVFVTIRPNGVATGHTVHLVKEGTERYYTVTLSPLLGLVDAVPGYVEPEVVDDDVF